MVELGLSAGHSIVDIGCGSGRLSTQLSRRYGAGIDYLGIDVVPELLAYARSKATPGYRFELTTGLSIPAPDASVDFVAAFSIFTSKTQGNHKISARGQTGAASWSHAGVFLP
jgi:ubiquinone/menaquinone biosynthesis C-methylase UbiE